MFAQPVVNHGINARKNKMTEEMKQKFNEWIEMNGGEDGSLYMTFSDEELEQFFLTAVEVYEKNKR